MVCIATVVFRRSSILHPSTNGETSGNKRPGVGKASGEVMVPRIPARFVGNSPPPSGFAEEVPQKMRVGLPSHAIYYPNGDGFMVPPTHKQLPMRTIVTLR